MQAGAPVVSAPGTVPVSLSPELDDVKIDEGTMSFESVPCALSADVGGGLPLVLSSFVFPDSPVCCAVFESVVNLRCVACRRMICSSMAPSRRVGCMGGAVEVREHSRLHGAPHLHRVCFSACATRVFWVC